MEGCCVEKLPSQKTKGPYRCSGLPSTPGEGNALHPALGRAVQYHQPPSTHLQTDKHVGQTGAEVNWLNTAFSPSNPHRNSDQE